MDWHCLSIVIALTLWGVLQPCVLCDYVKARRIYKDTEQLTCSFTVPQSDSASPCNSTLRQVFRILTVSNTMVTIGSTECVYTLDKNLTTQHAAAIPLDSTGVASCEYLTPDLQEDFMCKNYILYGYNGDAGSGSFRVCGTFSFSSPMCWQCTDNGNALSCGDGVKTAYMPSTPTQNFTIARATDNGQDYFFIGGLEIQSSDVPVFAKVLDSDANVTTAAVKTEGSEDQIMYKPLDFVGEPIEHGQFIYFFFRERAKEYDNIGNIIYSRVARVCKNDTGGTTNPLAGQFTTFLKTRLNCSVGNDFPFQFNEIEDVKQSVSDPSIVYGLFTTPNAGTSSSAICRYDLDELDVLFNTDSRRGQTSSTQAWQTIARHVEDKADRRDCSEPYDHGNDNIYNDLQSYPLMNTNAPNCGLSTSCSNFERNSDNALAVFENVRGQKLAIRSEENSEVTAFIGTNDRTILQIRINSTQAYITQKIEVSLESIPDFTPEEIIDKWPYGVSYLQLRNGKVYGTLDNCAFQFTPTDPDSLSLEIIDRTKQMDYNHSTQIPLAVTTVFKLFEAPEGTQMQASFSGLFTEDNCTQKRFTLDSSCREFLHVVCSVRDISSSDPDRGNITISSLSESAQSLTVSVTVNLDDTAAADGVALSDIMKYDSDIAEYKYNYRKWLRNDVDCSGGVKSTCPGPSDCCGNC